MSVFKKMIYSGAAGSGATLVYLFIGHFLDIIMNAKISNIISLSSSSIINYYLQSSIFHSAKTSAILYKYIISLICILGFT